MANDTKVTVPKIVALEVLEKNGVNIERLKELVLGLGKFFETSNINTLRRNLDYIKELLTDFNSRVKRFPSKKEIIKLIQGILSFYY